MSGPIRTNVYNNSDPGMEARMHVLSFAAEMSQDGEDELAYPTRKQRRAIASPATGVRRLTPRECERLQSLPDDWTAHGADSKRYAALGDAVTANVAEWIGRRLWHRSRGAFRG